METRHEQLLRLIIDKYVDTAIPVGSEFLVTDGRLDFSAATVRNEMRQMEEQGFLTHPHTSAGRIPTVAGFKYYIENLAKPENLKKAVAEEILEILKQEKDEAKALKTLGKYLASYMRNAIFIAWNADSIYYTGLSHLFSQPEFRNYSQAVDVGGIFDECEKRIADLLDTVQESVKILVGEENPLGANCGTIAAKVGKDRLLAIVGPMRMDYNRGLGIMEFIKKIA